MERSPKHAGAAPPPRRLWMGGADIERALGYKAAASSERAGWRDLSLNLWRGNSEVCDFAPFAETVLIFHTGGARSVRVRVGERQLDTSSMPGSITLLPPGTPICWQVFGEVHSCSLHLPDQRFARVDEERGSWNPAQRLRFRFACQDRFLEAALYNLAEELRTPRERGSLYVDTLGDAVVLHLMRDHAGQAAAPAAAGGLSRRALGRCLEQLESSIGCGVSLQDLAATAGLSRSHFTRAFRQSTGLPAHRYLSQRRVEHASTLLRDTALSLVEIADRCGFSSQSHFSQTFRRLTGTTPLAYRRHN